MRCCQTQELWTPAANKTKKENKLENQRPVREMRNRSSRNSSSSSSSSSISSNPRNIGSSSIPNYPTNSQCVFSYNHKLLGATGEARWRAFLGWKTSGGGTYWQTSRELERRAITEKARGWHYFSLAPTLPFFSLFLFYLFFSPFLPIHVPTPPPPGVLPPRHLPQHSHEPFLPSVILVRASVI